MGKSEVRDVKKAVFCAVFIGMALPCRVLAEEQTGTDLLPWNAGIEVRGDYVPGEKSREIYCVDLSWGEMNFIYEEKGASTWNPETHIYELKTEGEWKAQGNQIYLANHSGGPVRAEFSFQAGQAFTRLTGSFVSENIDIKSAAGTEPEKPPEGMTALYLSGNLPRSSTQWETLGEVTVCITQE